MKISYFHAGAHHTAIVERYDGQPFHGRAGLSIGHLDLHDGRKPQDMPLDEHQQSFVDGGEKYRAACRAAWAALRAQDSGATVTEPVERPKAPPPAPWTPELPESY